MLHALTIPVVCACVHSVFMSILSLYCAVLCVCVCVCVCVRAVGKVCMCVQGVCCEWLVCLHYCSDIPCICALFQETLHFNQLTALLKTRCPY